MMRPISSDAYAAASEFFLHLHEAGEPVAPYLAGMGIVAREGQSLLGAAAEAYELARIKLALKGEGDAPSLIGAAKEPCPSIAPAPDKAARQAPGGALRQSHAELPRAAGAHRAPPAKAAGA